MHMFCLVDFLCCKKLHLVVHATASYSHIGLLYMLNESTLHAVSG